MCYNTEVVSFCEYTELTVEMVSGSWFAVVLNWNLALDTIESLRSLEQAGLPLRQVILVDNGSTDDSLNHFYCSLGHDVKYIPLSRNLGFAGGINVGIAHALESNAEWILLINNDTVVAPTFFQALMAGVKEQPTWRLISPLILYADEPNLIWSMGDRQIGATLLTRSILRDQPVPPHLPEYFEADSLNACALLIHRSVFDRIGLFDTSYFMYAEDADFCWRARKAGFRLGVATSARMWHKVSRSTGVYHPHSRYWRIRNQIVFYRKSGQSKQTIFLFVFAFLRTVLLTLTDAFAGRFALISASWSGWFDGWRVDLWK